MVTVSLAHFIKNLDGVSQSASYLHSWSWCKFRDGYLPDELHGEARCTGAQKHKLSKNQTCRSHWGSNVAAGLWWFSKCRPEVFGWSIAAEAESSARDLHAAGLASYSLHHSPFNQPITLRTNKPSISIHSVVSQQNIQNANPPAGLIIKLHAAP